MPTSQCYGLQGDKHPPSLLVRLHNNWYCYSEEAAAFTLVPRMPIDVPHQLTRALNALQAIEQGRTMQRYAAVLPCM